MSILIKHGRLQHNVYEETSKTTLIYIQEVYFWKAGFPQLAIILHDASVREIDVFV